MRVGDLFKTYTDFEKALNDYKKSNNVDFVIQDCKTASSQKHRYTKLANTSEDLRYYYVRLMCVHGGVKRRKKICQVQQNTS